MDAVRARLCRRNPAFMGEASEGAVEAPSDSQGRGEGADSPSAPEGGGARRRRRVGDTERRPRAMRWMLFERGFAGATLPLWGRPRRGPSRPPPTLKDVVRVLTARALRKAVERAGGAG